MKLLITLGFLIGLTPLAVAQPTINPSPTKLECPGPVGDVAFSPDGKLMAAGTRLNDHGLVRIWSTADFQVIADLKLGRAELVPNIVEIEFSPDGKLLAAANQDGDVTLSIIGSANSVRTILNKRGRPESLSFSKDGTKLAFASEEAVIVSDLNSGKSEALPTAKSVWKGFVGASFSPTNNLLFVFRGDSVEHWDVENRKLIKAWKTSDHGGFFGGVSPDGNQLITGGGAVFGPKLVEIWTTSGIKVGEVSGFRGGLFGLAISHSARLFAVAGGNYSRQGSTFSLWTLNNQQRPGDVLSNLIAQNLKPLALNSPQEIGFVSFGDAPLRNLTFSPDDKQLAVASEDWSVLLYDVDRIRGPRREKRHYALCGEILTEDERSYIVPLSKVPSSRYDHFEYDWKWEVIHPTLMKSPNGSPVILSDWEYEISAGRVRVRVNQSQNLLTQSKSKRRLDHIVFGDVQNPGWDEGLLAKLYQDGTFMVTNNPGQCLAYGQLDQSNVDFKTVRTRLVNQGLLTVPKEPLVSGIDHFHTRFIELRVNGISELRSDEDGFIVDSPKREMFGQVYEREEAFIKKLRNAGLSGPQ